MALFYEDQVCKHLGVTRGALAIWRKRGDLKASSDRIYSASEIDAFLANCEQSFGQTLSWADLTSGRITLTTAGAECERLKLKPARLHEFCKAMSVEWIRYPGVGTNYRYSVSSLEQAEVRLEPAFSAREALRMTGMRSVSGLLRITGARVVYNPWSTIADRVYIHEVDFRGYLRSRLPPWIDPEDWIDDCRAMKGSLKSLSETAELLGFQRESHLVWAELNAREALYIRYGKSVLVLPEWIVAQTQDDYILSADQVARALKVNRDAPEQWVRDRLFVCPIVAHSHPRGELAFSYSCWLAYLRLNCTPSIEPRIWAFLTSRLKAQPIALYTLAEAATEFGRDEVTLRKWAQEGRLPCVRLPDGELRFTHAWMRRARVERRYP